MKILILFPPSQPGEANDKDKHHANSHIYFYVWHLPKLYYFLFSLPTCFISALDIYSPSYAFYCLLVESIWGDRDSAHIAPASSNSYAYACCA